MRAVWALWLQPWRQSLVITLMAQLLWLVGMCLIGFVAADRAAAHGMLAVIAGGCFIGHSVAGQTLRGLCRAETFLLPRFRLKLALLGLVGVAQWVVLPCLLLWMVGVRQYLPLEAIGLLAVAVFGLSVGSGRRIVMMVWFVAILAGWKPLLFHHWLQWALDSHFTIPVALLLIAALLLYTLYPLLRVRDADDRESPLEGISANRGNLGASSAVSQPKGALAKRINRVFDTLAQRSMDARLAAYRKHPHATQRLALVRSLLLPHDNLGALVLRVLLVSVFASFYFLLIQRRPQFNATIIGVYAVLLTMTRFPQLGRGMPKMRPNLADLYLTLAPTTYADYQKTIADALLLLVPVSVVTALAYTALGIVLVHASTPLAMLLATLIVSSGASLAGLAAHLIGPEGSVGRALVNMIVLLGAMACYWAAFWLIDSIGYLLGGAIAALVTLSFGISVWLAARREYQRRLPLFDAPLI